jgi:hypothetical protein
MSRLIDVSIGFSYRSMPLRIRINRTVHASDFGDIVDQMISVMLEVYSIHPAEIDSAVPPQRYVNLQEAKDAYRKINSGGCRMLSEGQACKCFLCQLDDMSEVR